MPDLNYAPLEMNGDVDWETGDRAQFGNHQGTCTQIKDGAFKFVWETPHDKEIYSWYTAHECQSYGVKKIS